MLLVAVYRKLYNVLGSFHQVIQCNVCQVSPPPGTSLLASVTSSLASLTPELARLRLSSERTAVTSSADIAALASLQGLTHLSMDNVR